MIHKNLKNISIGKNCTIDPSAFIGFEESGTGTLSIGPGTRVKAYALLRTCGGTIKVGGNTSIGVYTVIHALGNVLIGDSVLISPHVGIYAQSHGIAKAATIAKQKQAKSPIVIGNDVWIGSHAVLLGPLTIGNGAIIGAGSIVTKSVEAYKIVAGNPARVVGERT